MTKLFYNCVLTTVNGACSLHFLYFSGNFGIKFHTELFPISLLIKLYTLLNNGTINSKEIMALTVTVSNEINCERLLLEACRSSHFNH